MNKRIAIAGAGISGMSSAWMLVKKGYEVTVFSKAFSPNITSNKAAAFWFPYHIRNDQRGIDWCRKSFDIYKEFTLNAATGVSMQVLKKVIRNGEKENEPLWVQFMPENSCRILPDNELDTGFSKIYEAIVPLIETQLFLPWLQAQLQASGVAFIQKELIDLNELSGKFDAVANCTAMGARELCRDEELIPVRGQVALLSPFINEHPIYLDNEKPMYVVPRKDAIIVGGTYEENVDLEETEPAAIEILLENAFASLPHLKNQPLIGTWAGLRPYRKEVRVELEAATNIIHNYGHGGSGFTLSFGCAETVASLADDFFEKSWKKS